MESANSRVLYVGNGAEDYPVVKLLKDKLSDQLFETAIPRGSSEENLIAYLVSSQLELVLMDISLKGTSFVNHLLDKGIPILFVAHPQEQTSKNIKEELTSDKVKPKEELKNIVDNLLIKDSIFVRDSKRILQRIKLDSIKWMESDGNYCIIYLKEGRKCIIKGALSKNIDQLKSDKFVQIHKSYIVQANLIESIDLTLGEVYIDGQVFPLGRKFKRELLDRIKVM